MAVGANTKFVGTQDFGSEPYLISIGSNGLITDGVRFVTHDGGIQVPMLKEGAPMDQIYGKKSLFGAISIGNNVFIGVGAILLSNTTIRDNSIIAAGAIVKGDFPENAIIAGNPAKNIGEVDAYYARNRHRILDLSRVLEKNRGDTIANYVLKVAPSPVKK
jgi:acetyltransferase-like isoleucine patch superfamily enzyme